MSSSRAPDASSLATSCSRWRSVSTTSIASMTSSRGAGCTRGAVSVAAASAVPASVTGVVTEDGSRAPSAPETTSEPGASAGSAGRCESLSGITGRQVLGRVRGHRPRQRRTVACQSRQTALAVLDRVPDLGRVGRALLAHVGDDLDGLLLVVHHRLDELLDGVRPDGGPVAGLERFFLDLAADLGEGLAGLAAPFLHGFDAVSRL